MAAEVVLSDNWPSPPNSGPTSDNAFAAQLREMNEALLLSSVRQHELTELAERANAVMRETNARFEAIFATSPFGMYLVDERLCIRQVSRKALPVFGDIGELIGRDLVEVIHALWPPDSARDIISRFRHTLKTGEPYSAPEFTEVRYDRNVREYYDWQIHRIALPDGQYGVVCYFVDIAARVLAEESSQRNAERLTFVIDSMPQKIMTALTDGSIDYINPQWTEYTGMSFEQIKGWGWKQFIHPDDLAETERLWAHSIHTGETYVQEHRFRGADGEYCWHLSRMLPLRASDGRIVMWVGSNTEIHQQRQTANELRRYAEELSEADGKKNEFLAMVAHELRNPLAPIRNAVHVLQLADGNGDAVQAATAILDRQVQHMVRLVDDLLDVNRFILGKIELRRKPTELASIIHHAVEAVEPLCRNMDHILTVELPVEPIHLNVDPVRLTQVFENLLTNACKFTNQRGHIRLTVARVDGQAVITVQDNGIGLSAEALPRIFTMFTQVDFSLERSVSGLGIGLSLVKNLVTLHGGTVEAHSEGLGYGSTFIVRLPNLLESPVVVTPAMEMSAVHATTTARRILVVDDNVDSAKSLSILLQWSGNDTQVAHDGLDAIEAALTYRPHVILLDIGLPKVSGYEACRRIRAGHGGKDFVIVALTGMGQPADRQKALEAGFDDHLIKPVAYADLNRLLSQLRAT